jgi:DNA-binding SARP family transcriptional activator/tetratricopeptide (TPR) repeat protein
MGDESGTGRLLLCLLGEVRLHDGEEDVCPRSRKARALLAFLATAPTASATRERIADLLWTDRAPEQARGSLRQTVAEVRRCAPSVAMLAADRERLRLETRFFEIDVQEIRRVAADRSAPELARWMGEVRGPFAEGLDGTSPGLDAWLRAERPQQHEAVIAAVLEAVEAMLGSAGAGDLQAIVRGLDQLEPLNEAVARFGMRADAAGRDRASIHRRFRRLEDGLRREFGVDPSDGTKALFARLTTLAGAADGSAEAVAAEPERVAPRQATSPPTIIVASLAADPRGDDAELAAVCTDDIRVALTRLRDLRVIALEAADAGRLEAVCEGAIGIYMLSGRLRRLGGEVRVNLQLGNVQTHVVVWSEQIRIAADRLFDAVDEVVERAAGAVLPSIDRDLRASPIARAEGDGDAASLYTSARLRIKAARSLDAAQDGCRLLERVLELDGRHLGALLLLARMHNTDFWQTIAGHDVRAFRARAEGLCRRAAAIEPSNIDVAVCRAWCHLRQREWAQAESGFRRAQASLPHDPDTTNQCAFGFAHLGDLETADALMQRAFRLNPFPPPDYHADHAVILALAGRAREAEEHFEVSGEQGLQYLAVRLANLERLGDLGARAAAGVRPGFRQDFRAAWRRPHAPGTEDVLGWIEDTMPLRREEHRAFLRSGLAASLSVAP